MRIPPGFSAWFREHEIRADAAMGTAPERALLHLGRAVVFLEQRMLHEALIEANIAAHLDAALRPSALVVARMCVRREVDELRKAA